MEDLTRAFRSTIEFQMIDPTADEMPTVEVESMVLDGLTRERLLVAVERQAVATYGPTAHVHLRTEPRAHFTVTRDGAPLAAGHLNVETLPPSSG